MRFATAMNDGSVRLLEYDEGVIKPMRKYIVMYDGSPCNALCYNNGRIICGSEGGSLISIDMEGSSKEVVSLVCSFWIFYQMLLQYNETDSALLIFQTGIAFFFLTIIAMIKALFFFWTLACAIHSMKFSSTE